MCCSDRPSTPAAAPFNPAGRSLKVTGTSSCKKAGQLELIFAPFWGGVWESWNYFLSTLFDTSNISCKAPGKMQMKVRLLSRLSRQWQNMKLSVWSPFRKSRSQYSSSTGHMPRRPVTSSPQTSLLLWALCQGFTSALTRNDKDNGLNLLKKHSRHLCDPIPQTNVR